MPYHYESSRGRSLHLPEKDEFSRVPMDVLNDLGGFTGMRLVKQYEFGPDHEHIRRSIDERGYHVEDVRPPGQE